MSYRFLDHATDAFIEVNAANLKEAFSVASDAVVDLTLDRSTVNELQEKRFTASGKDLRYLLFNWLEELVYTLITDGFAIGRVEFDMTADAPYVIQARAFGEPLDLKKHGFRVEIKAPTFHGMEISVRDCVFMRFLLDL